MSQRRLHFTLTEDEASEVVHLISTLEDLGLKDRTLARAANKLDEQQSRQTQTWERCPKCDGSGWVEGRTASKRTTQKPAEGLTAARRDHASPPPRESPSPTPPGA